MRSITHIPTDLKKSIPTMIGLFALIQGRLFANADSTLTDVLRSSGIEAARPDLGTALFRMIIFLAMLLGLIFLISYWARRFTGQKQLGGHLPIHIVSSKLIGQKKALYVVEIAQRWFVLGVSESSVNLISELDKKDVEPYAQKEPVGEVPLSFQSLLSRLVLNRTVKHENAAHE